MNRSLATFLHDVSIRGLLVDALDRVIAWQMRGQEAQHMRAMDDRQLRDIGLSRADIERILSAGPRHR